MRSVRSTRLLTPSRRIRRGGEAAVRARIGAKVTTFEDHPYAGQATSRPGVRRLFVRSYPYFVEYRIAGDAIIVMRIRHSARRLYDLPLRRGQPCRLCLPPRRRRALTKAPLESAAEVA
jgi:plasmid stabilization system protein ParE